MKKITPLLLVFVMVLSSCSSVKVATDYDSKTDFNQYKTFAFYKKGIDKAAISDLDKRRILKAIEVEMLAKGFKKSKNPDLLVSIFAKSRKQVDIDSRRGFNDFYWFPSYYSNDRIRITKRTEGALFIDFIDAKKNKLVWQGIGRGSLKAINSSSKKERITTFVNEVLMKYPPGKKK